MFFWVWQRMFFLVWQECCFRIGGLFGVTLLQDKPSAGGMLGYNPAIFSLLRRHRTEDRRAHDVCCYKSAPEYCRLYYELRPVGWCSRRATFSFCEQRCALVYSSLVWFCPVFSCLVSGLVLPGLFRLSLLVWPGLIWSFLSCLVMSGLVSAWFGLHFVVLLCLSLCCHVTFCVVFCRAVLYVLSCMLCRVVLCCLMLSRLSHVFCVMEWYDLLCCVVSCQHVLPQVVWSVT